MSGEQRKSSGCSLLTRVLKSCVVDNVSLLGNFRAGRREREHGVGGGGERQGRKEGEKKKTPPARLALVQKALQLTHLVLIFQS